MTERRKNKEFLEEDAQLRQRLEDAEETLLAITSGEVDALVVKTKRGEQVFTLQGADTVYRIAIENINEGVITLSLEGTVLYANSYFAKMMRTDLNRLLGASLFDFVRPDDRDLFVALLGQDDSHTEARLRAADGNSVPARIAITKLQLDEPTVCAVVTDLTEHKKVEEEVSRERQRLYTVLETLPAMICLLTPDYHVPFANRSFRQRFGESQGRKCYEYCYGNKEPCQFCESYEVLKTGKPHHWEITIPSDGKVIDVYAFPFYDVDGSPMILEMDMDITQQRKAEMALRELNETLERRVTERTADLSKSEERFRTLSETSPVGVGVSSSDGVLLYANPSYERILGYSHGELIGKKASNLYLNPEDRSSWLGSIKTSGVARDVETRLKRKDGTPVWVSINVSTVIYGGGQAVMGTVQDITERKRTEQIRDEFIGMVSHELRTPLTVIIGALDTAMDQRVSKEEQEELVRDASSSAESLAGILDNMLELSRYQAGRLKLEKKAVKIADIAVRAVNRVRRKYDTHEIVLDIPDGTPEVIADALRIEQVLYNLAENAVKYSPSDSEIRVFSRWDKNGLVVGVSDQGAGISTEDQQRLFEPFARLGVRDQKGVGLGLLVCKRLVEAHNGRLWVESQPGKGSTFLFTIPLGKPRD